MLSLPGLLYPRGNDVLRCRVCTGMRKSSDAGRSVKSGLCVCRPACARACIWRQLSRIRLGDCCGVARFACVGIRVSAVVGGSDSSVPVVLQVSRAWAHVCRRMLANPQSGSAILRVVYTPACARTLNPRNGPSSLPSPRFPRLPAHNLSSAIRAVPASPQPLQYLVLA